LPPGCAFAPRCRESVESCHRSAPPVVPVNDGAIVRCVHAAAAVNYAGGQAVPA
jgi:ABC-type dipeptide/oligopeptide/nickel transport system ATPase component